MRPSGPSAEFFSYAHEIEVTLTTNRNGPLSRASIRHVAQSAGVSMSSVSRVLSGHPDVSPRMRERVMLVVKELRYEPDILAQSLRRGASRSIGLVVRDVANRPMAQFLHGAERSLRGGGYSVMVMSSDNDSSAEAAYIRLMQCRRADGLLLSLASEHDPATMEALAQLDVPWIGIDCDLPKTQYANAVLFDHRAGMTAAIEHLLEIGHRRIALLTSSPDLRLVRERLAGLQAAYVARGLPDTSVPVIGLTAVTEAEVETEALLDAPEAATAIVAGSHKLFVGCVRALRKRGLVPGIDVAVVTITRDNMKCGQVAGELLMRRLNNDGKLETVMLPTHFEPRASCAGPFSGLRSSEHA